MATLSTSGAIDNKRAERVVRLIWRWMHYSLDDNPELGDSNNHSNGSRDIRQHRQHGDGDLDGLVGAKANGKGKDGISHHSKEKDKAGVKEKDKVGVSHSNSHGGQ